MRLINFEFKWNASQLTKKDIFRKYDSILNHQLEGFGTLNYMTSHDDGQPFDKERKKSFEAGTLLLLSPGASQIYYGDETKRSLTIEGTKGDATLRSFMNWSQVEADTSVRSTLVHYQKLGQFRKNHPAVGAGRHHLISEKPFVFTRTLNTGEFDDEVTIALDLQAEDIDIPVSKTYKDGTTLLDYYSGHSYTVNSGHVRVKPTNGIVLLEKM